MGFKIKNEEDTILYLEQDQEDVILYARKGEESVGILTISGRGEISLWIHEAHSVEDLGFEVDPDKNGEYVRVTKERGNYD